MWRWKWRLWWGAGAVLLLMLLRLGVHGTQTSPSAHSAPARPTKVVVGQLAPTIRTTTMAGGQFNVATVHRPVMLNFWASWCTYCKIEAPAVARLAAAARGHYRVITIDITSNDTLSQARAFAQHFHLPHPVLLDPTGAIQAHYLVRVLPTTYYLNSRGVVVNQVLGAETYSAMYSHIQKAGG